MKKPLAMILVILCAASLFLVLPSKVFAQDSPVEVVSYSWYNSPVYGYLLVVGELKNTGDSILSDCKPSGTIYTVDGEAQATTEYSQVLATQMLPGQSVPFYMVFSAAYSTWGNMSWVNLGIDRVDFHFFTSTTTTAQYDGLQLMADTHYVDNTGNYTVNGVVSNRGNLYPEYAWVVAAFYDASNTVVAVGYSNYITPHYLPPNETAYYTITPMEPTAQMATTIDHYSLQVLSQNVVDTPNTTPTPSPSTSGSPGTTPTPSGSQQQNSDGGLDMTLVYVVIGAAVIVVAVVAFMFVVRKKPKT